MEQRTPPSHRELPDSLVNTRYVDEQEMFGAVASMCQLRANRLAALDPDRNR